MKVKFNVEMLMATAAMATAIAAVVVAIIQTNIMHAEAEMEREHARVSVMPSVFAPFSVIVSELSRVLVRQLV